MGCGESKDSKGGQNGASAGSLIKNANKSKAPAHYPLLDTPEEQSARFLQLCNLPPEKPQELQQHQHGHAGNAASHHTNLLAVELHRVYTETRQRVFKQQQEDEEATAAQHEKEGEAHQQQQQQRMRDGPTTQAGTVNGMPTEKGATAAATKTEDGKHKASSSQEDSPILPPALQQPAQKEFSLCVNSSVEEAHRRHFTAFDVVEAVELFIGYVKHDLSAQQVNTQEKSSNPNNDHGLLKAAGGTETAAAVTPSVPWTCHMRCTLSGDSGTAERLLAVAQQRWQEEREASHIKQSHGVTAAALRHSNAHNSSNGGGSKSKKVLQVAPSTEPLANNSDASVAETGCDVKGGKCLLFIDAVFESAVPASFDRRTPWQLEIEVYFTA